MLWLLFRAVISLSQEMLYWGIFSCVFTEMSVSKNTDLDDCKQFGLSQKSVASLCLCLDKNQGGSCLGSFLFRQLLEKM